MTRSSIVVLALACCATSCADAYPEGFVGQCMEQLGLEAEHCEEIAAHRLPDALPPARGNRHADDPRAAELGRAIFFDPGFATIPGVSCASCHLPERAFQDGAATSEVIEGMPGSRNSPSLYNAAWNEGFWMWDGRADSLWSQPLLALENELEMATTRTAIAHRIAAVYRDEYEAIFGALPPLEDPARFPPSARPGDPAWEAMSAADRDAVNRIAADVGKALEAYMRRIASGPSAFDRWLDGDRDALDEQQLRGLARFYLSGCTSCHEGPTLSDDTFRVASFGDERDRGRAQGIEALLASELSSAGPYFDRDAGEALPLPTGPTAADERAFRVPSLRNVAQSAPYQHDGSRDLRSILAAPGLLYEAGDEIVIEAFLRALDGEPPPAEWTSPP